MRPFLQWASNSNVASPMASSSSSTSPMFRVLLQLFLLSSLTQWRTALAQQIPLHEQPLAGKNHLHGIRRLSAGSQESGWEHRHLRHIPSPREPQKRPTLNERIVLNGGGEPRPPIAQRVPVPLKEAPSPVLNIDERTVLAMSSAEAEALAQKLLQEAGMEQEMEEHLEQHQDEPERHRLPLAQPPPEPEHRVEGGGGSQLAPGERKRMERIQARWRKIGPLLRTGNSSSLLPLRRLRLVQHRRKLLQKDSRQRLPAPQHAASTDRSSTSSASTTRPARPSTIQTEAAPTTTTVASSTRANILAPRARQLASEGAGSGRHRVASAAPESAEQFDFETARRALMEVQGRQQQHLQQQPQPENQQQQQQQPRGWEPAQRMLRHRHRARFEQQQRQRKMPIFNGPLLAREEDTGEGGGEQRRQFGLRNEPREGQGGNRLEELLEDSGNRAEEGQEKRHHIRRPVQAERRFRLVPNKVVFRPRLKIRRPPGQPGEGSGAAVARGTDQRAGGQPIALPSLSTFQSAPDQPPSVPLPPAPEEPPPRVAPPPPPEPAPTEAPVSPPPPPPPPPPSPSPQPLPAMEIGSVGEQPPQSIAGGVPSLPTPETTTSAAPTPAPTPPPPPPPEQTQQPVAEGVVLGDEAGSGSGDSGLVGLPEAGPFPPGFSEAGSGLIGGAGGGESGLAFGAELGTPPPGFKESFGLNGFETSLGSFGTEASSSPTTTTSTSSTSTSTSTTATTTTPVPTPPPTTQPPAPPPPPPSPPPPPPPPVEEVFVIPENSGLRPVSPPREFQGGGGFGSHGSVVSSSGGGGGGGSGFGGLGRGGHGLDPPPPNAQVEPPQQPLKPEDFFTGESALTPNKRGPDGDGYGPSALPGAAIPPAPAGPPIGLGGAAAGIPPFRPVPNAIGGPPMVPAVPEQPVENEATTVKPSALLNFLNKADEGFNQVITHFERGTPLEAAAIDIMEVALGSQKLDSQAKLLSHVDRAIGLDNLQRLQRWANTGGAFDMIKEQFAKIAKNYKPPPEAANLFTVPPQLEYLFQSSSGKRRRRRR